MKQKKKETEKERKKEKKIDRKKERKQAILHIYDSKPLFDVLIYSKKIYLKKLLQLVADMTMEKHKGKWKWEADTFDARLEQFMLLSQTWMVWKSCGLICTQQGVEVDWSSIQIMCIWSNI